VEKDELFVGMRVDELVFELFVEFAAYSYLGFVLGGEDRGNGHVGDGFIGRGLLGALFG
jgi:hypothetical protein